MNNNIRLLLLKHRQQLLRIGNVALPVRSLGVAVTLASQIDAEDGGGGPLLESLVDNVVTEEAIAAYDEDFAKGASGLDGCVCCGHDRRSGIEGWNRVRPVVATWGEVGRGSLYYGVKVV